MLDYVRVINFRIIIIFFKNYYWEEAELRVWLTASNEQNTKDLH